MGISKYFRRRRWDDERANELAHYLACETDDNIARGMSPEDASRAARLKLGSATLIREEIYQMNTIRFLDTAWQDLRYGFRILLRNPTFAIVAVVTLALGTGANAAIFQLVNAVRLRSLPVERPHELVSIGLDHRGKGRVGRGYRGVSVITEPLWQQLREQQQAFSRLFAWAHDGWDLSTEGESRPARGLYVSGGYFEGLGVAAHAGRLLNEADDRKGCGSPGAVLSHGFWQARYGGNPAAIGQKITLDRRPFDILGVTPPEFFGVEVGRTFDVAVPLCAEPLLRGAQAATGRRDAWWLDTMGRVKPGWDVARAQAHLNAIAPGIFAATVTPQYNAEMAANYRTYTFSAAPGAQGISNLRRDYSTELWVLLGATGLVLLITCANLANLMLARATSRDREIAVRLAMGASRRRIIRQMLSESLIIAALGAVAGLLLSRWLSHSLVAFLGGSGNRLFVDLTPDWRVFGFILLLAGLSCLLFGLSPALKATGANPGRAMQAGGRSGTEGREAFSLRRGLVVVQVALSVVLVVGALLFARSLHNLAGVDLGFREDGLLSASIDIRATGVPPEARQQLFQQIAERIRAVPGVRGAATTLIVPLSGPDWNGRIVVRGRLQPAEVRFNEVGGQFFDVFEMPLLAGRTFDARDRPNAAPAAVVNETFARKFFPNRSPVGETFQMEATPGNPQPTFTVVGLVRDSKYRNLREPFVPIAYLASTQTTEPWPFVEVVVRSDLPMGSITPSLTRAITETASGAAVRYESVSTYIADLLATDRLMASLSGFFGVLAMLIATIGLYGVMSYMVSRRKIEIGVRMALGAQPRGVVRMVLGESGALVAAGMLAGLGLAVFASRWAGSLLYGLEPWDPASFGLAILALGTVSLLAAWIPARRASRLAPSLALRE